MHINAPSLVSFHTPARLLYDVAYGDTSQGKLEEAFRERRKSASRLLNRAGFYSTNPTSHREMSGNYPLEHATYRAVMLYESFQGSLNFPDISF